MDTLASAEKHIRSHVMAAVEGFVDYFEAGKWLATFPTDASAPDAPIHAVGISMLWRELDRLHGKPAKVAVEGEPGAFTQDRQFNVDYRRGPEGRLQVSIRAVRGAAQAASNAALVRILDEARDEAAQILEGSAMVLKRSAMAQELKSRWPTIEADLNHASSNGLSAARAEEHGMWNVDKALKWASRQGKLSSGCDPASILQSISVRRHKAR